MRLSFCSKRKEPPLKSRFTSLGRNDAPVLTVAVYFFIQEPKSLMFLSFFLKRNSEIVQRP